MRFMEGKLEASVHYFGALSFPGATRHLLAGLGSPAQRLVRPVRQRPDAVKAQCSRYVAWEPVGFSNPYSPGPRPSASSLALDRSERRFIPQGNR